MLSSLQIAALVGFNLLLLVLTVIAFRLIGDGKRTRRRAGRAGGSMPDELFAFDSWSESEPNLRPMTRPDRDRR